MHTKIAHTLKASSVPVEVVIRGIQMYS